MSPEIDTRLFRVQLSRWGIYVRLGWVSFGIGCEYEDYERTWNVQAGIAVGFHRPHLERGD